MTPLRETYAQQQYAVAALVDSLALTVSVSAVGPFGVVLSKDGRSATVRTPIADTPACVLLPLRNALSATYAASASVLLGEAARLAAAMDRSGIDWVDRPDTSLAARPEANPSLPSVTGQAPTGGHRDDQRP